jgi:hypothetical protein
MKPASNGWELCVIGDDGGVGHVPFSLFRVARFCGIASCAHDRCPDMHYTAHIHQRPVRAQQVLCETNDDDRV